MLLGGGGVLRRGMARRGFDFPLGPRRAVFTKRVRRRAQPARDRFERVRPQQARSRGEHSDPTCLAVRPRPTRARRHDDPRFAPREHARNRGLPGSRTARDGPGCAEVKRGRALEPRRAFFGGRRARARDAEKRVRRPRRQRVDENPE